MENLQADARQIQQILPWLQNTEDIIEVLERIPVERWRARIPLSLVYFFKNKDEVEENFEQKIEEDVKMIVLLFPDIPESWLKLRLKQLGNIQNRKEIVIRQLLNDKPELKEILLEIESQKHNKKRTSEQVEAIDESFQSAKINKKVVLDKCSDIINQQNLVTSLETTQCENVPSTNEHLLTNLVHSELNVTNPCPIDRLGTYNLIEQLKELTSASETKIKSVCKQFKVDLHTNPQPDVLNELLNYIYDDCNFEDDAFFTSHSNEQELKYLMEELCEEKVTEVDSLNESCFNINDNLPKIDTKPSTSGITESVEDLIPAIPKPKPSTSGITESVEYLIPAIPKPKPSTSGITESVEDLIPAIPKPKPSTSGFAEAVEDLIPAIPKEFLHKMNFNIKFAENQSQEEIRDLKLEGYDTPLKPMLNNENFESSNQRTSVEIRKENVGESTCDEKLVSRIMEIFPDVPSKNIRRICLGKTWNQLDDVVTIVLSTKDTHIDKPEISINSEKKIDVEEQLELIKQLLPDADPTYLRVQCEVIGNNIEALNAFVNQAKENKNYPTLKEYLRKQKLSAQVKKYTSDFNVQKFVDMFPEPEKTFIDPNRKVKNGNYTSLYIRNFFQNRYDQLSIETIDSILASHNNRILPSDEDMKKIMEESHFIGERRKQSILKDVPRNVKVLQEIAYLIHKEEIIQYMEEQKQKEVEELELARKNGLLVTCQCCFDDEVLLKNVFKCPKECTFCRNCIRTSCSIAMGEGRTTFLCLNDCTEEFSLSTLQKALPPKLFSKLAQKKTFAEIQAAGIEELESCPFCDFVNIPNPMDKIFRCLNPDCMKESCRMCREENHIPYKCDEVEKDEEVKARVFIENQMTAALLRKCYKCGKSFFKEQGCNHMRCVCGASMCYICQKPLTFGRHSCPVYSDTIEVHKQNVAQAAELAKSQVDSTKLKIDPSTGIEQYYENQKKLVKPSSAERRLNRMRRIRRRNPPEINKPILNK